MLKYNTLLKTCFLLLISGFAYSNPVEAQGLQDTIYKSKIYGLDDGLISRNLGSILSDENGFVWIGSDKGLIRFDGNHFYTFNSENTKEFFIDDEVDKIYIIDNKLYVTNKRYGVLEVDLVTYKVKRLFVFGVTSMFVHQNKIEQREEIFIYEREGYLSIYHNKELFKRIFIKSVESIIYKLQNKLFMVIPGGYGFATLDLDTYEIHNLSGNELSAYPTGFREQIIQKDENTIYYVREGKIFEIDTDHNVKSILLDGCEIKEYITLDRNLKNDLTGKSQVLICENKLFTYNGHMKRLIDKNNLPIIITRELLSVDENSFLLTSNQGLVSYKALQESFQKLKISNLPRVPRRMFEIDENKLIFFGGQFTCIQNGGNCTRLEQNNIPFYDAIKTDKFIFATTEANFFYKLDLKGNIINIANSISPDHHYGMLQLNDSTFVAGTWGGLTILENDIENQVLVNLHTISSIIDNRTKVLDILNDPIRNGIWLGTENGVSFFSKDFKKELLFISKDKSSFENLLLRNSQISDLYFPPNNKSTIWVAGDSGIDIIDIESGQYLEFINMPKTDKNVRIVGFIEDKQGRVWVPTFRGIMVIDPLTLKVIQLDSELRDEEFNYKSMALLEDGRLIFGGLNGVFILQPQNFDFESKEVDLNVTLIERFTGQEKTIEFVDNRKSAGSISFDSYREAVNIYLSVNDLLNTYDYTYEYRLSNLSWVDVGKENIISVYNLSEGRHRLEIRAKNSRGQLLKSSLSLDLISKVPFYNSKFFYSFLIFFLAVFILLIALGNTGRYKNEINLKRKISMDLHDEVGTILTRTILLLQDNSPLNIAYQKTVLENLSEGLFSLRQFINSLDKGSVAPKAFETEIKDLIFRLTDNLDIMVMTDIKIENRKNISENLLRDLKLIVYELFTNTIKHSDADKAFLEIHAKKNIISLQYFDNGQLTDLESILNKDRCYGLENIKRRAEKYSGKVEYLIADSGNGLKTKILINN